MRINTILLTIMLSLVFWVCIVGAAITIKGALR